MGVLNSNNKIAEATSGNYSASGYVACVEGDAAAIGSVSHCSCYGTWDYESGEPDGCNETWSGDVAGLIDLATRKADPSMPERPVQKEDFDSAELLELYDEILSWNESRAASN